jgi:hypothetical protein
MHTVYLKGIYSPWLGEALDVPSKNIELFNTCICMENVFQTLLWHTASGGVAKFQ